jgi:hypothetical protein
MRLLAAAAAAALVGASSSGAAPEVPPRHVLPPSAAAAAPALGAPVPYTQLQLGVLVPGALVFPPSTPPFNVYNYYNFSWTGGQAAIKVRPTLEGGGRAFDSVRAALCGFEERTRDVRQARVFNHALSAWRMRALAVSGGS